MPGHYLDTEFPAERHVDRNACDARFKERRDADLTPREVWAPADEIKRDIRHALVAE